jgi:RsiW-degrading membrane proteinase PrsW (M82 family)
MSPATAPNGMTREKALRQARLVALFLLAAQVLFLGVVATLVATKTIEPGPEDLTRPLTAACVVVFAVLVPLAFILRRRLAVPGEPDGPPAAPENLLKAHIIFAALCEMVTLLCLVSTLVHGALVSGMVLALLAMGVQATNVPRAEDPA